MIGIETTLPLCRNIYIYIEDSRKYVLICWSWQRSQHTANAKQKQKNCCKHWQNVFCLVVSYVLGGSTWFLTTSRFSVETAQWYVIWLWPHVQFANVQGLRFPGICESPCNCRLKLPPIAVPRPGFNAKLRLGAALNSQERNFENMSKDWWSWNLPTDPTVTRVTPVVRHG